MFVHCVFRGAGLFPIFRCFGVSSRRNKMVFRCFGVSSQRNKMVKRSVIVSSRSSLFPLFRHLFPVLEELLYADVGQGVLWKLFERFERNGRDMRAYKRGV